MNECIVIGASPSATLPEGAILKTGDVFCADGGLDLALRWGLTPTVVIGDFDSAQSAPEGPWETFRLPREKDDTDLLAAVKLALERGFQKFRIWGALGGRFDHAYGNLSVLRYLIDHGAYGVLEDGGTQVYLCTPETGTLMFTDRVGATVSVFPFGAPECTATYRGLQYPLEHGTLSIGVPIGASNVISEQHAEILVEQGMAVVMALAPGSFQ